MRSTIRPQPSLSSRFRAKAVLSFPMANIFHPNGPFGTTHSTSLIPVLQRDKLAERAAAVGEDLLSKLRELAQKYPEVIKEVRGKGLMIGLDLTKEGVGGMLMNELINGGVLVAYTLNNPKVIRMEPPLTISADQIQQVLSVLAKGVAAAQEVIEDL